MIAWGVGRAWTPPPVVRSRWDVVRLGDYATAARDLVALARSLAAGTVLWVAMPDDPRRNQRELFDATRVWWALSYEEPSGGWWLRVRELEPGEDLEEAEVAGWLLGTLETRCALLLGDEADAIEEDEYLERLAEVRAEREQAFNEARERQNEEAA